MTRLTKLCWLTYNLAALPLALFAWFAFLFWITAHVLVKFGKGSGDAVFPWGDRAGPLGFWSFGVLYCLALWGGHRLPPRISRWAFVLPIPWIAGFLAAQVRAEGETFGAGLLPPSLQGGLPVVYLVILLAILTACLIVAAMDVFESKPGKRER